MPPQVINVSLIEHRLFQIQPVRARIKAEGYLLPICGNLSPVFRTARRAGFPVRPGTAFPFCRAGIFRSNAASGSSSFPSSRFVPVLRCVIPFVQRAHEPFHARSYSDKHK